MNEFDKWRLEYDTMTYEQQVAYHNDLESRYPEQNHFNYNNVFQAIASLPNLLTQVRVLEFGTWKGDLAKKCMEDFAKIKVWYGIEICDAAIANTKSDRVLYIKPSRFDWFAEKREIDCDIIIATHFIEHISNFHFEQLAEYCKGVGLVHFESPLTDEGREWGGCEATHKLTMGWNKINEIMANNGFDLFINHPESKTYKTE